MYKELPCLMCPVFPMCKLKTYIDCPILIKHLNKIRDEIGGEQFFLDAQTYIKEFNRGWGFEMKPGKYGDAGRFGNKIECIFRLEL